MKKIENRINQYAKIGIALSAEKDINRLLEMIVDEAQALSNADAGTLYIISKDRKRLRFEIMNNNTLNQKMGGTHSKITGLPDVELYTNGESNYSNVSSYVALTGETVNLPDVYQTNKFNLTGTRKYDTSTGYRSISMIVIPLKNHENSIIGVLQLLNAKDPETGEIIEFSDKYEDVLASLASQAAVALTNRQLIQDLENLFYAFIKSIAMTIDEKSPYTGGHIKRVVGLTMLIAETINKTFEGPLSTIHFNEDEMEELRISAWMHDVGKMTSPEYIVDKATRLETITDRIESVKTRFDLIEKIFENDHLMHKIQIIEKGHNVESEIRRLDQKMSAGIENLHQDFEFIKSCNTEAFLDDEKINRLEIIAAKTYNHNNEDLPFLTDNELRNLSVRKGTLLEEERKVIENHAKMTLKITEQLPFPEKLSKVPEFAAGHHEKLDGSGYPNGLSGNELPIQTRIMAIADIFEALTARDRPYKKATDIDQVLKILTSMKNNNLIDPDIYDIFIGKQLYKKMTFRPK